MIPYWLLEHQRSRCQLRQLSLIVVIFTFFMDEDYGSLPSRASHERDEKILSMVDIKIPK